MLRARLLALPANTRGALWILLSAVCFTGMSVLIRQLAAYPSPVQAFIGNVAILVALSPGIVRTRGAVLSTRALKTNLFRAFCSVSGVMLYYYSFQKIPLAEANALSFTRALWLAPIAALLLHERVGAPRWAALVLGFGGVLLIAHPTGETPFGWPHVAGLLSALLLAGTATGVKMLTREMGPGSIVSWASVLGVVLTAPFALATWKTPTLPDLALLASLGIMSLLAQLTYIRGMAVGQASAMAPIDYSRLVFAVAVGFLLYGEVPTLVTLGGIAVIVAATLITLFAPGRRRAAPDAAPPA